MPAIKCPHCGLEVSEKIVFCQKCGYLLINEKKTCSYPDCNNKVFFGSFCKTHYAIEIIKEGDETGN